MKKTFLTKLTAALLCVFMLISAVSLSAYAVEYTEDGGHYLKMVSKRDWELAPGIAESEIILSKEDGSQRQVCHVVEVDPHNPYTKVMPSTYKMKEGLENKEYKVQTMSEQVKYAEEHGYGNVVAATNIALNWYAEDYYREHPELIGEPLGTLIMDGVKYTNSQGPLWGAATCLVINFDEKDGVPRPAHMPKTEMRWLNNGITGWEEQLIPIQFYPLVENGKNIYPINDPEPPAPRTFVGIKEDGTIVIVMNEGRQEPFSRGFNCYEMAEFMISLGCVWAFNSDGGGSSTFLSQRPGEEMELHCSPSDGVERATTHGILIISTAPAAGEFEKAHISSDYDYYTPGSSVQLHAVGMDHGGAAADIPARAVWQLSDSSYGNISDSGLFVSNGKQGIVTVQMTVDGEVVGEKTVHIVTPDALSFASSDMAVAFGGRVDLGLNATFEGHSVALRTEDVTFTLSNPSIGSINGFYFTAGQENLSALTSTLTAQVGGITATTAIRLGKGSQLAYSFEDEFVGDTEERKLAGWAIHPISGDPVGELHVVGRGSGKGKNGDFILSVNCDYTQVSSAGKHTLKVTFPPMDCAGATSVGFWLYVPRDARYASLEFGDGGLTSDDLSALNEGWHYVTAPVSGNTFSYINFSIDDTAGGADASNLNGNFTFYIDDITLHYSDAVPDHRAPAFSAPTVSVSGNTATMQGQTVYSNTPVFEVLVTDDPAFTNTTGIDGGTAKAYIDGVEVSCVYESGKITASGVTLTDGNHTVKFHIADKNGNTAWVDGTVLVQSGSNTPTVQLVPRDPAADRLLIGSLYWMDLIATDMETIDEVELTLDLNNGSIWELEGMTVSAGFTATYSVKADDNIATVIITRTGESAATGQAILASIPVRTWVSESDKSPATLVKEGNIWAQSIELSLVKGEITYTADCEANVLGAFGMTDILVDTELFFNYAAKDSVAGAQVWIDTCVATGKGFHEHRTVAIADKAPTANESGYVGRTACSECGSVVGWGTVLPATGHIYTVRGDRLICSDCGKAFEGSGLQLVSGKAYYMIGGKLLGGWQSVEDEWYYFDTVTYAAVETLNNGYVTFAFEADGKLVSGQWYRGSKGFRYYYGPAYYVGAASAARWFEIDGKTYCFPTDGYCYTGVRWVDDNDNAVYTWYDFGTDGALIGYADAEGLTQLDGKLYYVVNHQSVDGLRKVGEDYYYFPSASDYRAAVTNTTRYCSYTFCDLPAGTYTFGPDGRMLNKVLYTVNDVLYYYEKGNVCGTVGRVGIDGKNYEVQADGKVLYTGLYTDVTGEIRYYHNGVASPLNGLVGDYYYINGIKAESYYGLVEWEGCFYYVNEGGKIVRNMRKYVNKPNGLTFADGEPIPRDYFNFDADGKMIIEEKLNGPVDGYFYKDGKVLGSYYGLVEWKGSLYYVDAWGAYIMNARKYVNKPNGLTFPNGEAIPRDYFYFDAEGKMIVKQGIADDTYYVNGISVKPYHGLVEWQGNYYYVDAEGTNAKIIKSMRKYVRNTNGLAFPDGSPVTVGYYEFDAEGKMILKQGFIDDQYYVNGIPLPAYYGLIEDNGSFYYLNDYGKPVKDTRKYVNKTNGLTFADGTPIPKDYFYFDAEGKMVIEPEEEKLNGPVDGYFYRDGAVLSSYYGLVEWEGDFYYVDAWGKYIVGARKYVNKPNGLIFADGTAVPRDYFYFDADGKMILD